MARSVEGSIDLSPREARYDETKLAVLEEYLARRIDAGVVQGASFLIARRGKVFAHRALGRRSPAADAPALLPDLDGPRPRGSRSWSGTGPGTWSTSSIWRRSSSTGSSPR
ncbi:MAG TPA: hypothetical protein VEB43_18515 [Anaeromyxobacter sp.]|nr:hypothetical protein [Anaeromyxobacter sp.]